MGTLRDWQSLQDLVERGEMPWLLKNRDDAQAGKVKSVS